MNSMAMGYKRISNTKFSALVRGQEKRRNAIDLKIETLQKELNSLKEKKSLEEVNDTAAPPDDEGETPSLPLPPIKTQWVNNKQAKITKKRRNIAVVDPIAATTTISISTNNKENGNGDIVNNEMWDDWGTNEDNSEEEEDNDA